MLKKLSFRLVFGIKKKIHSTSKGNFQTTKIFEALYLPLDLIDSQAHERDRTLLHSSNVSICTD